MGIAHRSDALSLSDGLRPADCGTALSLYATYVRWRFGGLRQICFESDLCENCTVYEFFAQVCLRQLSNLFFIICNFNSGRPLRLPTKNCQLRPANDKRVPEPVALTREIINPRTSVRRRFVAYTPISSRIYYLLLNCRTRCKQLNISSCFDFREITI